MDRDNPLEMLDQGTINDNRKRQFDNRTRPPLLLMDDPGIIVEDESPFFLPEKRRKIPKKQRFTETN